MNNKECCGASIEKLSLEKELILLREERDNLYEENLRYKKKVEDLKNECIDFTYERGLFLEDEVLKKIEKENCRLRAMVDEVYNNVANVWFDMIKTKIKKEKENN